MRRAQKEFQEEIRPIGAFGCIEREQFAERQRALRASIGELFARWANAFGIEPPLPPSDVAAMTFFMADGFLLDRVIDPRLDDRLYATMLQVFLRGLMEMARERE